MLLQLKRSPESGSCARAVHPGAADSRLAELPQVAYPDQFAQNYGVAQEDVSTVTAWLQSHGFTVNGVQASGLTIDFSGSAAQVRKAFHTDIHHLSVNGGLDGEYEQSGGSPLRSLALVGVVSMHDFHPTPHLIHKTKPAYTYTNTNGTFH